MSGRRRKQIDPLEQAVEAALSPGNFISHKVAWSLVHGVQDVANDIENIINKQPERAARLFETLSPLAMKKPMRSTTRDRKRYLGAATG